jgi:hypothetical protein
MEQGPPTPRSAVKTTRIVLASLLVAAIGSSSLIGGGTDPSQLRTDGDAPDTPVTTVPTVDAGDAGDAARSGGSGSGDATATTVAPTTTAPPPAPTTTVAPIATPTGELDQSGRPVWTPSVDASGHTDVSGPMARFLAAVPDGSTVELRAGGRYRMESTWVISGRRDLTIRGNGATLFATTQGDMMRASVRIADSAGITVRDLVVVGANPLAGAKDRTYRPEWGGQHGFDVNSSSGVSLLGVTVTDTYGDFVYLGQRDGGAHTDGVLIQASTFARSGRQGITFTAARNVVVETSTISEPKRSMFDFEPGRGAGMSVDHVTVRNNRLSHGPLLFVAAEGHGPVDQITIQANRLTGMTLNIAMEDLDGGQRRDWKVLDNTGDLLSGNPHGATMRFVRIVGLEVRGNYQAMKPDRDMVGVGATNSCNLTVTGNNFPNSVGQLRTTGTC